MPQLIVRQIEHEVVQKLKERAARHGVSMEEEHRSILRKALTGKAAKRASFKDYLLQMPELGKNEYYQRNLDQGRDVEV